MIHVGFSCKKWCSMFIPATVSSAPVQLCLDLPEFAPSMEKLSDVSHSSIIWEY